jgi:mono/diheme cytochrome c family protein
VVPPSLVDHVGTHPDGDRSYWIQNGISGGMPAFAAQLGPSQTWDIVNYLWTIEAK